MTLLWSAIQSGGIMRRKLFTPLWKARTGTAKIWSLFVPAVEAVLVAAEVTLQNFLKARTLKAEKILPEEVAQMLRNILKDCWNKGVRRSLLSLTEFSFAHQRVRILLRKNKKTRYVGLFGVPHFANAYPAKEVAVFIVAVAGTTLEKSFCLPCCYATKQKST